MLANKLASQRNDGWRSPARAASCYLTGSTPVVRHSRLYLQAELVYPRVAPGQQQQQQQQTSGHSTAAASRVHRQAANQRLTSANDDPARWLKKQVG